MTMRPLPDNNARHLLDLLLNAADPVIDLTARSEAIAELLDWADGMRDALTAAREYHREVSNRASDGIVPLPQSDAAKTAALLDLVRVAWLTYPETDGDCPRRSASDVVEELNLLEARHADTLALVAPYRCEHCGIPHALEGTVTCEDCNAERESGDLEI